MAKKKGLNRYKIKGDTTILYLEKRDGRIFECLIDTEDLEMLINLGYHWSAAWEEKIQGYYAKASVYRGNGQHNKTYYLHKIILGIEEGTKSVVHHKDIHKNHNSLDNRKVNLEEISNAKNVQLRNRANKNNRTTGVRNITYVEDSNEYWIQMCKDGERFKWVFPAEDNFDEICRFTEEKRIEIFGEV